VGIESQAVRLLLIAREMGADLSSSLTIGRQDLLVTGQQLKSIFADFDISLSDPEAEALAQGRNRFAEPLFERLGAQTVDSLDASSFEGATIVHDLNQPHDPALEERFSLVFDAGTLEHVFDVPRALRTIMSLVRPQGHLLMALPANNEMGHGFFQFSPDLFFRVLSRENGYRMKAMFLAEPFAGPEWFAVRDPAEVHQRVGFNAPREPHYLFLIAQRIESVPLFAAPPQQSDYAAEWSHVPLKGANENRLAFFDREMAAREAEESRPGRRLIALAPQAVRQPLRWLRQGRRLDEGPDARQMQPFLAKGGARLTGPDAP
jgi:SAM-dependent methyltransferase